MKYIDAKLIRQTKAINFNGTSYIYDLDRDKITDFELILTNSSKNCSA